MGNCISSTSSEIRQAEDGLENVIYFEASNGVERLGSVYSKEGSKGLNQDAAILHEGYGVDVALCGVFDGHGKNGHIVSKIVRDRLPSLLLGQKNNLARFSSVADDFDLVPSKNFHVWKEACASAFKAMDKEIKLQESLDTSCSGTTAVVALRQGGDLVVANLGDSRAILGTVDENGVRPIQLTRDLKPNVPSEADRIRKCNGRVFALKEEAHIQRVWLPHEDCPGLAMSRAFGDFMLKNHGIISLPEISYRQLTSNDQFVVLASDGVWDVLSNDQVAKIVWAAAAENKKAAAQAVVDAATATWKNKFPSAKVDDCSAVCLFLQKRQQPHITHVDFIF